MDPQRLLQVQQAANPSLRAAATPASLLQGGGITPQYAGINPQSSNYNPQANQINYLSPTASPYHLSGPVQVAHPQPLYVGNPMNPATSVISQGTGTAGAQGAGPSSNAQSVIANTGMGVLKGAGGLVSGTVLAPLNLSKSFNQFFGNLGSKLAGGKPDSQQSWDKLTAPVNNAVSKATNYATGVTPLTRLGQNTGAYDVNGNPIDQASRTAQRVGSDLFNVATLANPAKDAYLLGSKAVLTAPTKLINSFAHRRMFSAAEQKVLEQAGIKVAEDSTGPAALASEHVPEAAPEPTPAPAPEAAPTETPTQPKAAPPTPAEVKVARDAGIPPESLTTPPKAAPAPTAPKLTPVQQQLISDFPNGLDKPAMSLLKKQGFTDHPNILAEIKQQIVDAHAAANPDAPRQAVEKAVAEGKAPVTQTVAEAQNTKAAQATTGKIASEVPTGEHYLDESNGKSVPIDTMHPRYAKNALAKMQRENPELVDSSVGQALKARAESSGRAAKPASDIPNLTSKEGKLSKLTSLENRANNIGESGKAFNNITRQARIDAPVIEQRMQDVLQPFHDLTPEEQATAVDVKEGKATTDDPHIQAGVQALHDFYKGTHETLTNAGVDMGNLGDNYFNHNYPKGFFNKPDNFNAAVKSLVDSGKAESTDEAIRMVNRMKSDDNVAPNKFGNLKTREADVPGYLKNSDAVNQYAQQAAKHIAQVKNFGVKGEHLQSLVKDAINNGEDAGALQDIIKSYSNPKTPGTGIGSKALTGYQKVLNVLQLPRAAVSHIPQLFANTGSDVGFAKTAQAIKSSISDPEMQQFLHDAGFDIQHNTKGLANRATAPGLQTVLHQYRAWSGAAGREVALGLAKNGDAEGLSKIGVNGHLETNPDGSINLSHDQQVQAAHFTADKNIGTDDIAQSPAWTQDQKGKIMSAYQKMYVFKQGERIVNMFKDARNGNVAPLARYLAIGAPVAGTALTVAKNEIKNPGGNPIGDKGVGNFAEDVFKNSGVGTLGLGLVDKAANAVRYNFNNDSRWQNAASAVAPGAGFAVQTGQNVDKALRGKPNPLERQVLSMAPVGGKYLADKFAPLKNNSFQNGTNTGPPKTVADLKALNQKTTRDFVKSLSSSDKQAFTDSKGNFIDSNTAAEAHKQGILNDDQYNHYEALHKVLDREQGKTQYSYNNPALDAAHASGKINDEQYNLVKQYEQHNGQVQADLTAVGKKAVANRGGDQQSQQINQKLADNLNTQLPPGLSKLNSDPDLAKSYVAFMNTTAKDAQKAPEDQETAIDYNDRLTKFWAGAAKDGAPPNVQSIYRDGGNKAAMYVKQGKATPDDVSQAVGLDNMLLAAGLETSPKFSKSFRKANGFPAASTFQEGGAMYGTNYVAQALGTPGAITGGGSGGKGGARSGFGNGNGKSNLAPLNDGSGIFSSVNKKTGDVTLKNVPSLNGTGMTAGEIDPTTGLFITKPTGISKLLNNKDTTFSPSQISLPSINTKATAAPKLKNFAAADVRGTPRPQRAVPIRFQRVKFEK